MKPMSEETARWIRVLRVELGCTWGRVGELYEWVTGDKTNGALLCEIAADTLGENPGEDPWN